MARVLLHSKDAPPERIYWSNVAVTSSQVFLGIFAAVIFLGEFDQSKIFVLVLNGVIISACWFTGWRLIK